MPDDGNPFPRLSLKNAEPHTRKQCLIMHETLHVFPLPSVVVLRPVESHYAPTTPLSGATTLSQEHTQSMMGSRMLPLSDVSKWQQLMVL
jgi:hypothetical protein